MNWKQHDKFMGKVRERLIFHQEDYKRKKKLKGEEVDCFKMHNAIEQRKEMKQIKKILNKVMLNQFEDHIEDLREFELKNSVFIIGEEK